jgi:hypothetical protein
MLSNTRNKKERRVLEMRESGVRAIPGGGVPKEPSALLWWLNNLTGDDQGPLGKATKASRARVSHLLREINETSAMLATADVETPDFDFFDFEHQTISPRVHHIQQLLDDYPKWPSVEIAYKDDATVLNIEDGSGRGRPLGEQLAVWDIVRLTNSGDLKRVRQCECAKWYYAKRPEQRACSARCRHKIYEQTDHFKANRRKYMREYYALKQSGKVK